MRMPRDLYSDRTERATSVLRHRRAAELWPREAVLEHPGLS